MVIEADLNSIVSNVLSENHFKHCRLCLKDIQEDNFLRFEDQVYFNNNEQFHPLVEILDGMLDQEVCLEIPGVDAVCSNCAAKCVECWSFLQICKKSNAMLHKIFDNLFDALNIEIDSITNQQLYVIVGENESKAILKEKDPLRGEAIMEKEFNYNCNRCDKTFDTELEMYGHSFKCPEPDCEQHRCTEKALKEHQDKAHTIYVCKDCGKSCHGLDRLEIHEKRHNFTKSKCPKCDKQYLTQSSYQRHVELCLAEKLEPHPYRAKYEKKHFCSSCGKGYSTAGGLRVHERFEHGNAKPHICERCGKKFTAPSYLKIHMVTHTGAKNFNCSICSKSFVSKEALLYHTRRHTGEKPFSCKLCNEKFVNASSRAEHIKFKHDKPKLTCDICQRNFYTSSFLKQHRKRHFDPVSKLYSGRNTMPPNMPGEQNIRKKSDVEEKQRILLIEDDDKTENFTILT